MVPSSCRISWQCGRHCYLSSYLHSTSSNFLILPWEKKTCQWRQVKAGNWATCREAERWIGCWHFRCCFESLLCHSDAFSSSKVVFDWGKSVWDWFRVEILPSSCGPEIFSDFSLKESFSAIILGLLLGSLRSDCSAVSGFDSFFLRGIERLVDSVKGCEGLDRRLEVGTNFRRSSRWASR